MTCITAQAKLRVLIVDDSERIRRGLRGLLELADDIEAITEASDGAQGVELAVKLEPDVVLMDIAMPAMDGIEATRRIRAARVPVRILVVTGLPGQQEVARRAGADGLLVKDSDPLEIIQAVRDGAGQAPPA
jgi:DNA-binding NarL/FixJ family response regulator